MELNKKIMEISIVNVIFVLYSSIYAVIVIGKEWGEVNEGEGQTDKETERSVYE